MTVIQTSYKLTLQGLQKPSSQKSPQTEIVKTRQLKDSVNFTSIKTLKNKPPTDEIDAKNLSLENSLLDFTDKLLSLLQNHSFTPANDTHILEFTQKAILQEKKTQHYLSALKTTNQETSWIKSVLFPQKSVNLSIEKAKNASEKRCTFYEKINTLATSHHMLSVIPFLTPEKPLYIGGEKTHIPLYKAKIPKNTRVKLEMDSNQRLFLHTLSPDVPVKINNQQGQSKTLIKSGNTLEIGNWRHKIPYMVSNDSPAIQHAYKNILDKSFQAAIQHEKALLAKEKGISTPEDLEFYRAIALYKSCIKEIKGLKHIAMSENTNAAPLYRNTRLLGRGYKLNTCWADFRKLDVSPKALEQMQDFYSYYTLKHYAKLWKPIEDGFRLYSSITPLKKITDQGNPIPKNNLDHEITTVDRKNDPALSQAILNFDQPWHTENILDLIKDIFKYVNTLMKTDKTPVKILKNGTIKTMIKSQWKTSRTPHKEIPLGNFITGDEKYNMQAGMSVCRHKALLMKLIADHCGIPCSLNIATVKNGGHAWNEILTNQNSRLVVDVEQSRIWDCTNNKIWYYTDGDFKEVTDPRYLATFKETYQFENGKCLY